MRDTIKDLRDKIWETILLLPVAISKNTIKVWQGNIKLIQIW